VSPGYSDAAPHGYDLLELDDRGAWRAWLERHHADVKGVWLVSRRVQDGAAPLDYDAVVEEALCFGWVDSREQPVDDERLMRLLTPRKAGSAWARSNKERVARLDGAGRLAEAGRRVVERAKADGSWSRYDSAEALEIPADLADALARHAPAAENFEAFTDAAKRTILRWLIDAKRAETRARRIDETARLAAKNERAGP
jgi:uncharacterized protein YdeI (YjbR/CyaY-like superfamily)